MSYVIAVNRDPESNMPTFLCETKEFLEKCFTKVTYPNYNYTDYSDNEGNLYQVIMTDCESKSLGAEYIKKMRKLYK